MQATLCVIFAGSVALAQMVVMHHRGGSEPDAREDTSFGPVERMVPPAGWVQRSHDGRNRSFLVYQEPEKPGQKPRILRYRWEQLSRVVPLREYLLANEVVGHSVDQVIFEGHLEEEFQLEEGVGVLIATTPAGGAQSRMRWIACTILPDGKAITLEMDCPEVREAAADKQTLLDTAQSMEFRN
jgi:hypothetical protein